MIINTCVNGHEKKYDIQVKDVYERVKKRTVEAGKWKCPHCLALLRDMRWEE